jgi:hypothetical protein
MTVHRPRPQRTLPEQLTSPVQRTTHGPVGGHCTPPPQLPSPEQVTTQTPFTQVPGHPAAQTGGGGGASIEIVASATGSVASPTGCVPSALDEGASSYKASSPRTVLQRAVMPGVAHQPSSPHV